MAGGSQALPHRHAFLPAQPVGWRPSWLVSSLPLVTIVFAIVTIRCWVVAHVDFETDEAYYWLWSRHLAASYYDHPLMVAYLIGLGTSLFGDTIMGIRSMAIVAMIAASAMLYFLALVLFGNRRVGVLSVLWFQHDPAHEFLFDNHVSRYACASVLGGDLCGGGAGVAQPARRMVVFARSCGGAFALEQIYRRISPCWHHGMAGRIKRDAVLAQTACFDRRLIGCYWR